jgi:hypothetical protein
MTPNVNRDPQYLAQAFAQYIRAAVSILIWTVIGLACLAAAYIAIRGIWVAVQFLQNAIGI